MAHLLSIQRNSPLSPLPLEEVSYLRDPREPGQFLLIKSVARDFFLASIIINKKVELWLEEWIGTLKIKGKLVTLFALMIRWVAALDFKLILFLLSLDPSIA